VHEIYVLMSTKIFLGGDSPLIKVILCKASHSHVFMTMNPLGFGQK